MVYKKKINKLLVRFKKNIAEIALIFLLNILVTLVNYLSICLSYIKFADFDFQTFLTWNYSALNSLIPYRDLYYPYGLLAFYKDGNILFLISYFLVSLVILNTFIFIIRKVFGKKIIVYFITILFLIFVYLISNLGTFNRYGISVVVAMTLSYLFYSNVKSKKFYFFSGFILSTIFWLVHDQGIFGFIIFFLFLGGQIWKIFNNSHKKSLFESLIKNIIYFATGSALGLLPFIIYLVKNNALISFWYYLTISLPEFPLMSKTPFFNLFFSLNNIFSISVLSFSIFFVVYKIFQKKNKSVFTYLEIGLIITIILFEQKNIVRLMENAITFAAFILFAVIFWEIITKSKKSFENNPLIRSIYFLTLILIVIIFYFIYGNRSGINTTSLEIKPVNCYAVNLSEASNTKEHDLVIQKLKKYKNFNNKILSYPGDPIFYVLLEQNQPYFTSIYEASSKNSQMMNIDYLNKDIKYVVINTQNNSIQDEVPNYIRGVYELKYILNNYSVKDYAGKFLILEKRGNSDFFSNSKFTLAQNYKNYLLDINLESIPLSEGIYKEKYLLNEENKIIVKDKKEDVIDKFLASNFINSENTVILVKNIDESKKYTSLKITSGENHMTNIKMKSCLEKYCVINLSNLPLFYNTKQIKEIDFDDNIFVSLLKVSDDNIIKLW